MTGNATRSCRWGNVAFAGVAGLAVIWAAPASAQDVKDDTVTARDVALSPLQDLNLRRDEIPAALVRAATGPYANSGLAKCSQIQTEIADLDAVLGDDFDTAQQQQRKITPGKVALGLVSGLIPYRGIIRELSGASDHEHDFKQAISAGLMRRAYLKGLGEAKRCPYPARPMPPEMAAAVSRRNAPVTTAAERTEGEPVFVSQAVIQSLK